ncbi:ACT domain-containing protein [Pseudonocardia xishanensis]|uniref:ACT domain-containing protein n=1 Tax=Pseudonocardia xishanensis TaxID=630995 RepID=UPI0031E7B95A
MRVRLPDESGALARLTEAVAQADGNILGLAVHGQDSRSVVDEMFVGSAGSAEELAEAIRRGLGTEDPGAVLVTPADPHDLVDAPTRALDLAVQAVSGGDATALARGLGALVHADAVRYQPTEPPRHPHVLAAAVPQGGWLVAMRDWAPFTVTEQARAEAFLRAADVEPVRPRWDILTLSGAELVAEHATGDEIGPVEDLLCACLAGLEPSGERATWTDRELRALLITPRGPALLVRDEAGVVVALGAVVEDELVLLVHPHYRGMRLARWLRKRLTARALA